MSLKKFLIIMGFWVAFLPHIGFSILTENVLFSITGFVLIVASFYLAAIEDKHKYKRVVQGEILQDVADKVQTVMQQIPYVKRKQKTETSRATIQQNISQTIQKNEDDIILDSQSLASEDQNKPRIKKAVSDVKLKTDSFDDDIIS